MKQASNIPFGCVVVCMTDGLFICLFNNMYVYYFRYRDQDEMGRIFEAVSLYHFKLSQGVSDKKCGERRKFCLSKNVYRLPLTNFNFCWLLQNPGLYFFSQGESEFQNGDLLGAIQDFSTALSMLGLVSTSPPQLTVKALLRRAQCFFFLVRVCL